MTFQLDTSGRVACNDPHKPCICHTATWDRLTPFTQGYVEALFVVAGDAVFRGRGDGYAGFADLAPETLAQIIERCERAPSVPRTAYRPNSKINGAWFHAMSQRGDYLEDGFPPLTVTLGDDGRVYLREAG